MPIFDVTVTVTVDATDRGEAVQIVREQLVAADLQAEVHNIRIHARSVVEWGEC
jgi:hypothetical protein